MMQNKRIYRVKKSHVRPVTNVHDPTCVEIAFKEGYVFIKNRGGNDVFMISSTPKKKLFKVEFVSVEIVEG